MVREPCPNPKIIKNLCTFACSDPSVTPAINLNVTLANDDPVSPSVGGSFESSGTCLERDNTLHCDQYNGILTLAWQRKVIAPGVGC